MMADVRIVPPALMRKRTALKSTFLIALWDSWLLVLILKFYWVMELVCIVTPISGGVEVTGHRVSVGLRLLLFQNQPATKKRTAGPSGESWYPCGELHPA